MLQRVLCKKIFLRSVMIPKTCYTVTVHWTLSLWPVIAKGDGKLDPFCMKPSLRCSDCLGWHREPPKRGEIIMEDRWGKLKCKSTFVSPVLKNANISRPRFLNSVLFWQGHSVKTRVSQFKLVRRGSRVCEKGEQHRRGPIFKLRRAPLDPPLVHHPWVL